MNKIIKTTVAGASIAALSFGVVPTVAFSNTTSDEVTLTLLHNNDGESALQSETYELADGTEITIGGIAAFASVMDREIASARAEQNSVLAVYAGDSYLAGPTLNCSDPSTTDSTQTVYDAVAQGLMEYDVHVLGNHEFDFGTNFVKRFINEFDDSSSNSDYKFISGNMDFSANADLSALAAAGTIDTHYIHTDAVTGEQFGVVSAIYPDLPTISSPGTAAVTTRNIPDTAIEILIQS